MIETEAMGRPPLRPVVLSRLSVKALTEPSRQEPQRPDRFPVSKHPALAGGAKARAGSEKGESGDHSSIAHPPFEGVIDASRDVFARHLQRAFS